MRSYIIALAFALIILLFAPVIPIKAPVYSNKQESQKLTYISFVSPTTKSENTTNALATTISATHGTKIKLFYSVTYFYFNFGSYLSVPGRYIVKVSLNGFVRMLVRVLLLSSPFFVVLGLFELGKSANKRPNTLKTL